MSQAVMIQQIRDFLTTYPLDEWWPGINPRQRPLSAARPSGLYALIRIACPACGKDCDPLIAEAVCMAGYQVVEDVDGCHIERNLNSSTPILPIDSQFA